MTSPSSSSPSDPIQTPPIDNVQGLPVNPVEEEEGCSLWGTFDKMQLCYTLLPQIRHYYRYGSLKDCSATKDEFMFCLRMKSRPKDEAAEMIKERKREMEQKKLWERESRDVWTLRTSPPPNFPPPVEKQ